MVCSRILTALLILGSSVMVSAQADDVAANNLASRLITYGCAARSNGDETRIEWYKSIRQSYSAVHDTQYPDYDSIANETGVDPIDALSISEILTSVEAEHMIHVYYQTASGDNGPGEELFPNIGSIEQEQFEWCLHLFSEDNVSGCFKGNQTTYSGGFELLGLFDIMGYDPRYPGILVIRIQGPYVNLFQDAFLTCTIDVPWLTETRGVFWSLYVASHHQALLTEFPEQEDAFLVVGERKIFNSDVFVTSQNNFPRIFSWFTDGTHVQSVVNVRNENCTMLGGDFLGDCLNETIPITTSTARFSADQFATCVYGDEYRTSKSRVFLSFNSPSDNDTGEYTFLMVTNDNITRINRSVFISVVFTEFPSEVSLPLGGSSNLSCAMVAPSDATVYWLLNDQRIHNQTNIQREDADKDGFSMTHADLMLSDIAPEDIGQYSCVVEYTVPRSSQVYTARLDVLTSFTIPKDNKTISTVTLPPETPDPVVIGASVATVVIVMAVIILLMVIVIVRIKWTAKRKRRHTLRHRPSKHLLLKPHLLKGDEAYVDLTSPDIKKTGELEFPRENLELQVELGAGKFGRVFKAKAHGMVSSFPHINTVAVKTTINSGDFSENCRLLNELELLKKLYKQPHKNICNLLGHCTETNPLYVILEYACYGNLKRYLVSCHETLLSQGHELQIDSSTASVQIQQPNELTGQLDAVNCATNPLQIELSNLPVDSKEPGKSSTPFEATYMEPGQITESQLCDYASQIANGLKHLAYMGIVHCDLAARNIFIAEKGVLKIGDYGMAREVSSEEAPYQNLRVDNEDCMIAAKWAAPELLEIHPHTLKSDVWSYAITLWEIASYGSEPFSEFRLGASLEPFLRHLQQGNRPAKPVGLPNYIYRQMSTCWSVDPNSRPSAEELLEFFDNIDPNTVALEDMLEDVDV